MYIYFNLASDADLDFNHPVKPNANGIVPKHAYSVLDMRQIKEHRLLCLRNTWGNTYTYICISYHLAYREWMGQWSDGDDASWTMDMKQALNYKKSDDGKFWIALQDFLKEFNYFYVCKQPMPNSSICQMEDAWSNDAPSGGQIQYEETFFNNPQYHLYIPAEVQATSATCLITIQLLNKKNHVYIYLYNYIVLQQDKDSKPNPVGLYVFKNEASSKRLLGFPSESEGELLACNLLKKFDRDALEVTLSKTKHPYILVPSMWYPGMLIYYYIIYILIRQHRQIQIGHLFICQGGLQGHSQRGWLEWAASARAIWSN